LKKEIGGSWSRSQGRSRRRRDKGDVRSEERRKKKEERRKKGNE